MSYPIQKTKKLSKNELHIVSVIRSCRKTAKDSSHLKYANNNMHNIRKKSQNKSKEMSASSTLSTFRKAMNIHNSTSSLSHMRTKTTNTKNAVNINTNNNEINIHLSLNSDNQNNSSLQLEEMIKQKDALISKLQSELEYNQKILYKIQSKKGGTNKHSRHNKNINDLNIFLTKTKSSGFISSKASNSHTLTLFNNLIKRRVRSPVGFDIEKSNRNLSGQLGRLKTFSAKTQRIYKREDRKTYKTSLMSNEDIKAICNHMLERTKKICEMFNDICESK